MKKTYNLSYDKGFYIVEYSLPNNNDGQILIDEKKMELDSAKLYKMIFENVNDFIEVIIKDNFSKDTSPDVVKKGLRVRDTLQSLCTEICNEINKKCFSE